MREHIKRLHEERLNCWNQAKELLDGAETAKRELTGEEEQTYQRLNDRMSQIDARSAELAEAEDRAQAADAAFAKLLGDEPDPRREQRGRDVNAELREFLRGNAGRRFELAPAGDEQRDLVKGTATAGGNTVPVGFYGSLVEHMIENSGVLQAGPTLLTTDSGVDMPVPRTTAHGANAGIVAEGAPLPEGDPAFGQVTLKAYKYGKLLQIAPELLEDTGVDLAGYIARDAGRAVGNGLGVHLVAGTGTNQPQGVITAATVGVTGGTGVVGVFTGDNLIDLFYSVIAPYRNSPSCGWLFKDSSVATLRKIKDTTGQYIWMPGLAAGAPDTVLGKPMYTDPNVPATGVNNKSVVFGDFSTYFVRQVRTIRFERSDDYAFGNDLVSYRVLLRADGQQVDTTGAIKVFQGAAT